MLNRFSGILLCLLFSAFVLSGGEGRLLEYALRDSAPFVTYAKNDGYKEVLLQIEKEDDFGEYIFLNDGVTDEYAENNFYIVSSRTGFKEGDIDVDAFEKADLTIAEDSDEPKVLIFHTHSSEMFADSDSEKGLSEGIWCVGEELKGELERLGIKTYHHMARYDYENGKTTVTGAYERMEGDIRQVLEKYPSIELVIDMHRDGIKDESQKLVTEIDGEVCAKLMLFNGLSRLKDGDELKSIEGLENPYLKDNLALSYRLYRAAENMYPTLMRKIYIEGYRYSLHMKPKSILVEVGAQNNTKQEAKNSMKYLAKTIYAVCGNKNKN